MNDRELMSFRTKACTRTCCDFGSKCKYSHSTTARRCPFYVSCEDLSFLRYVPIPCPHQFEDALFTCPNGVKCPFAHTNEEINYHPIIYKVYSCNGHSAISSLQYQEPDTPCSLSQCTEQSSCWRHHGIDKRTLVSHQYSLPFTAGLSVTEFFSVKRVVSIKDSTIVTPEVCLRLSQRANSQFSHHPTVVDIKSIDMVEQINAKLQAQKLQAYAKKHLYTTANSSSANGAVCNSNCTTASSHIHPNSNLLLNANTNTILNTSGTLMQGPTNPILTSTNALLQGNSNALLQNSNNSLLQGTGNSIIQGTNGLLQSSSGLLQSTSGLLQGTSPLLQGTNNNLLPVNTSALLQSNNILGSSIQSNAVMQTNNNGIQGNNTHLQTNTNALMQSNSNAILQSACNSTTCSSGCSANADANGGNSGYNMTVSKCNAGSGNGASVPTKMSPMSGKMSCHLSPALISTTPLLLPNTTGCHCGSGNCSYNGSCVNNQMSQNNAYASDVYKFNSHTLPPLHMQENECCNSLPLTSSHLSLPSTTSVPSLSSPTPSLPLSPSLGSLPSSLPLNASLSPSLSLPSPSPSHPSSSNLHNSMALTAGSVLHNNSHSISMNSSCSHGVPNNSCSHITHPSNSHTISSRGTNLIYAPKSHEGNDNFWNKHFYGESTLFEGEKEDVQWVPLQSNSSSGMHSTLTASTTTPTTTVVSNSACHQNNASCDMYFGKKTPGQMKLFSYEGEGGFGNEGKAHGESSLFSTDKRESNGCPSGSVGVMGSGRLGSSSWSSLGEETRFVKNIFDGNNNFDDKMMQYFFDDGVDKNSRYQYLMAGNGPSHSNNYSSFGNSTTYNNSSAYATPTTHGNFVNNSGNANGAFHQNLHWAEGGNMMPKNDVNNKTIKILYNGLENSGGFMEENFSFDDSFSNNLIVAENKAKGEDRNAILRCLSNSPSPSPSPSLRHNPISPFEETHASKQQLQQHLLQGASNYHEGNGIHGGMSQGQGGKGSNYGQKNLSQQNLNPFQSISSYLKTVSFTYDGSQSNGCSKMHVSNSPNNTSGLGNATGLANASAFNNNTGMHNACLYVVNSSAAISPTASNHSSILEI